MLVDSSSTANKVTQEEVNHALHNLRLYVETSFVAQFYPSLPHTKNTVEFFLKSEEEATAPSGGFLPVFKL